LQQQLTLFDDPTLLPPNLKASRSGTFVDNMSLPIHRWFRYSAGFAAMWVEEILLDWGIQQGQVVLDPFVGSGTVPLVCDSMGINSLGVEAHPIVARICKTKLLWDTEPVRVRQFARDVLQRTKGVNSDISNYPQLIHKSFDPESLIFLDRLKSAWIALSDESAESELVWLALTSILRSTSKAGTAQWQYILPKKTKKKVLNPLLAFEQQIDIILSDLRWMQSKAERSYAKIIFGDARTFADTIPQ